MLGHNSKCGVSNPTAPGLASTERLKVSVTQPMYGS